MKGKLIMVFVLGLFFSSLLEINAQEKQSEKKDKETKVQDEDMQKLMEKIAADSTMRKVMMSKMMEQTKNDSSGMKQMCMMMMDNPEMCKMMMKMMNNEGMMNNMMNDSTKNKSGHMQMNMKDKMNGEESIIREGEIDLNAIDKNKDGKVYQAPMHFNVISDEPGNCSLCGMKLKEVTLEKAKENLIEHGFQVKEK